MGIGSSIAHSSRKYQPNGEVPRPVRVSRRREIEVDNDDDDDDLATVSSFRAASPVAHQDARSFTIDGAPSKWRGYSNHSNRQSYYNGFEPSYHGNRQSYHGSLDRGYRAVNGSCDSYSAQDPRFRAVASYRGPSMYMYGCQTMQDVREYLLRNPQLLAGKKHRKLQQTKESDLYGFSDHHKQMKTKQNVYLGLINPPVIYAAGVRPDDRQLRVSQKTYLSLVYPAMKSREGHVQAIAQRSRPPLKHANQNMIVTRKDGYPQQPSGYIRRPIPEMQVSRVTPRDKKTPEPATKVTSSHTLPLRVREGTNTLPKINQKRRTNDYLDPPEPLTSHAVKSERQKAKISLVNGLKHENPPVNGATEQKEGEVVFTFNVDDLQLKKRSEVARFEHDEDAGQVVPLYLRKSLAYSPKYEYSEDLVSSPL